MLSVPLVHMSINSLRDCDSDLCVSGLLNRAKLVYVGVLGVVKGVSSLRQVHENPAGFVRLSWLLVKRLGLTVGGYGSCLHLADFCMIHH